MISIRRSTGEVIRADPITPEANQKAWEQILSVHIKLHPELLRVDNQKEEKQ